MSVSTVLIVDDEKPYAKVIAEVLEAKGLAVHCASDATEALNVLQRITPDLILLDVMMPGIDGFTLLRWIRTHSERADIPIHVVSAKISEQDRIAAIEAGANGFLGKPFTSQELLDVVFEYLTPSSVKIR